MNTKAGPGSRARAKVKQQAAQPVCADAGKGSTQTGKKEATSHVLLGAGVENNENGNNDAKQETSSAQSYFANAVMTKKEPSETHIRRSKYAIERARQKLGDDAHEQIVALWNSAPRGNGQSGQRDGNTIIKALVQKGLSQIEIVYTLKCAAARVGRMRNDVLLMGAKNVGADELFDSTQCNAQTIQCLKEFLATVRTSQVPPCPHKKYFHSSEMTMEHVYAQYKDFYDSTIPVDDAADVQKVTFDIFKMLLQSVLKPSYHPIQFKSKLAGQPCNDCADKSANSSNPGQAVAGGNRSDGGDSKDHESNVSTIRQLNDILELKSSSSSQLWHKAVNPNANADDQAAQRRVKRVRRQLAQRARINVRTDQHWDSDGQPTNDETAGEVDGSDAAANGDDSRAAGEVASDASPESEALAAKRGGGDDKGGVSKRRKP